VCGVSTNAARGLDFCDGVYDDGASVCAPIQAGAIGDMERDSIRSQFHQLTSGGPIPFALPEVGSLTFRGDFNRVLNMERDSIRSQFHQLTSGGPIPFALPEVGSLTSNVISIGSLTLNGGFNRWAASARRRVRRTRER
jgi:hypothetical protein